MTPEAAETIIHAVNRNRLIDLIAVASVQHDGLPFIAEVGARIERIEAFVDALLKGRKQ